MAGSNQFLDKWENYPVHRINYRVIYTPVRNFRIWGIIRYRSGTTWSEYENLNNAVCSYSNRLGMRFTADVSPFITADLQFKKWFWHRRLAVSMLFRNLANRRYQYHPVGAAFDLSFICVICVLY